MANYLRTYGALLATRNGWICHYCGAVLKPYGCPDAEGKQATVDHVKPRACGGGNNIKNLVLACWDCNHKKADEYAVDR